MAISIVCPECAKTLRSSVRPPEGKKVKCPGCSAIFVPVIDDVEDEAAQIQAEPKIKASASSKRKPQEDDDDADDDAPRIKKKKGKKKAGSKVMLYAILGALGAGGALMCCIGVGVGAFFYFRSAGPDLLAFVAPDADVIAGGNPKLLREKNADLEKMIREQLAGNKEFTKDMQDVVDLAQNSERMLVFLNTKTMGTNTKVVVIFQGSAVDVEKFKLNPALGAAQTVGGHANVYKPPQNAGKNTLPRYVAFPGNQIVVMADVEEPDLKALLDRAKNPPPPSVTMELSRTVQKMPLWVAFTPDAEKRRELKKFVEMAGKNLKGINGAVTAIDNVKGLTLSIDITSTQDYKYETSVHCKTADDANKIKVGVEEAWSTFKGLLNVGQMMQGQGLPGQPQMPATLTQDLNSMSFKSEGAVATATLQISSQTITDLTKFMPGNAPMNAPVNPPKNVPPVKKGKR